MLMFIFFIQAKINKQTLSIQNCISSCKAVRLLRAPDVLTVSPNSFLFIAQFYILNLQHKQKISSNR